MTMRNGNMRVVRGLAALGVAAALGFGGTQAFASASAAQGEARCQNYTCNNSCIAKGYAGGSCAGATCVCWQT
jgi:hypothetical protein